MATGTTSSVIPKETQLRFPSRPIASVLVGYWVLTKPDVNFLIVIAASAGFCAAQHTNLQNFPYGQLISTLIGTLLVASGAATLNQVIEQPFDAQMCRTARRPLVYGSISPLRALWFGVALSIGGTLYLGLAVNVLCSIIAAFTIASYLFVYTPLKRQTPLCTFVGALPGAMPVLIGWAAASGTVSSYAWVLYLMLFLWQFPHFMAIAWMYRGDYQRAGYRILPQGKTNYRFIGVQSVMPTVLLVPVGLIPTVTGHAGRVSFAGAILLSSIFLVYAIRLAVVRSNRVARQLLLASIVYLPSLFLLMLLDKK